MASISSLGAGSNLNLQGTLDDLRKSAELQLDPIESRQTSVKGQISAYGQLKSALENLQKAATALGNANTLRAVTGKSSNDAVAAVTTAPGAIPGQYTIEVTQLASVERLESGLIPSRTAQNGAGGTIQIEAGGKTQTIELSEDTSLNGIVKAINNNDDSLVRATIVNGADGAYLMLSTKQEGTSNAISKITVTPTTPGDTALSDILAYDASDADNSKLSIQQPAKDAILTVNGLPPVTRSSNSISDVIDGVTIDLKTTTETSGPITVDITSDPASAKAAVQSFVDAYNALQTTIANLTAFDTTNHTQNALTGDSTTRSIESSVAAALRVTASEGTLRTLSELGIKTDATPGSNGKLVIDSNKLDDALKNNLADVNRIFGGENGLAERMKSTITPMVSSTGLIKTRTDGLQDTIKSLQDRLDRTQDSIDAEIEIYRQQFVQLDVLMSQLTSTSSYLSQQFAGLAAQR